MSVLRTTWSVEQRQIAIAMLAQGEPFRVIGARIGKSRNAVAAYVDRNAELKDMPNRNRRAAPRPAKRGGRDAPPKPAKAKTAVPAPLPARAAKPAPVAPVKAPVAPVRPPVAPTTTIPAPVSRNVALVDLKPGQCKWPGEWTPDIPGGFGFCGHHTADLLLPYCPYHAKVGGSGYQAKQVVRI